jgi:hypothetical protein
MLDRFAAQVGFRYTPDPLDFIQPSTAIATNKAHQLKLYLDARKAAAGEQARGDLLSGTALAGTGATPPEISAFRPGLPSVLDLSTPASATPPATGNPPVIVPSQTPGAQRLDLFDAAAAKNAPAVEEIRRSLALHDTGLDEAKIAQARAYGQHERLTGAQADLAGARRDVLTNVLNDPTLDPLLGADIGNDKAVFKKERVKVKRRDGTEGYYDATPNLSGGYDYAPALDKTGHSLRVPESEGRVPGNVKYLASIWYPDDPDGIKKTADRLNSRKELSRDAAWAQTTRDTIKRLGRAASQDPQKVYDATLRDWRLMFPGVPPQASRPETPALPSAPAAAPPPAPGAAAPAATEDPLYKDARAAIAKGANPAAVKARLKALGMDPGKL